MLRLSLLTERDTRRNSNGFDWFPGTGSFGGWNPYLASGATQSHFVEAARPPVPESGIVVEYKGNAPAPGWLESTIQTLNELLSLPADWDSYGARPIDPTTAIFSLQLLSEVMGPNVPAPLVVPTNRGGVQLEWHTRGIDLEIEIQQSGRISVCYEDHRSGNEWEEELTSDLTRLSGALSELSRRG
jgi:hypothetical protein